MRIKSLLVVLALGASTSFAAVQDWHVRYYAGTLNILDKKTGANYKEKVVMYHIVSPEDDMMTEVACVKDAGKPAYLVPTYMYRRSENAMTVSELRDPRSNSKLTGEAFASGKTWYWNKYTLTMKYAYSNKPNDYVTMRAHLHFVPGALKVRKRVWYANGQPKQDWSGTMPEISKERFLKIASAMKCPAIP